MQLAGIAAHANIAHATHGLGVEMPRAEKIEERRLGIDRRDDRFCPDLFSGLQNYADRAVAFDLERLHPGLRSDLDAHSLDGRAHRIRNRAHAAFRSRKAGPLSCRLGGETVEKQQKRIGRARPEVCTEHGIECHHAFQTIIHEIVVEHVGDIDQKHAHEFAHVVTAQEARLEADLGELHELVVLAATETRRRHVFEGPQHAGEAQELGPQRRPRSAIRLESDPRTEAP